MTLNLRVPAVGMVWDLRCLPEATRALEIVGRQLACRARPPTWLLPAIMERTRLPSLRAPALGSGYQGLELRALRAGAGEICPGGTKRPYPSSSRL